MKLKDIQIIKIEVSNLSVEILGKYKDTEIFCSTAFTETLTMYEQSLKKFFMACIKLHTDELEENRID